MIAGKLAVVRISAHQDDPRMKNAIPTPKMLRDIRLNRPIVIETKKGVSQRVPTPKVATFITRSHAFPVKSHNDGLSEGATDCCISLLAQFGSIGMANPIRMIKRAVIE